MKTITLIIISFSYGFLAAAGVFTVFVAVGLVPRFAGKTRTADKVKLYEEMVIWGSILGGVVSIFGKRFDLILSFLDDLDALVVIFELFFGVFSGMFIGCLAIAIAETLDSIPILTRRIKLKTGLRAAVLSMALGKMLGSLMYFCIDIFVKNR